MRSLDDREVYISKDFEQYVARFSIYAYKVINAKAMYLIKKINNSHIKQFTFSFSQERENLFFCKSTPDRKISFQANYSEPCKISSDF